MGSHSNDNQGFAEGGSISDAELTELALAADPNQRPDLDAVPIAEYLGHDGAALLPEWYMPAITARGTSWRRSMILLVIVGTFLLIEAVGLCSTYGQPPIR